MLGSRFSERYLDLKERHRRLKHLIHGGIEYIYAGLQPSQLLEDGVVDRLDDSGIDRALDNIDMGLRLVYGELFAASGLYIKCVPRPTTGEKTREAAWRWNVYDSNGMMAAAMGMNLHLSFGEIVATIANVQGHDRYAVENLHALTGETPWAVAVLDLMLSHFPQEIEHLRGIPSTQHPFRDAKGFDRHRASNLYDRTFMASGLEPVRDFKGEVLFYEMHRR